MVVARSNCSRMVVERRSNRSRIVVVHNRLSVPLTRSPPLNQLIFLQDRRCVRLAAGSWRRRSRRGPRTHSDRRRVPDEFAVDIVVVVTKATAAAAASQSTEQAASPTRGGGGVCWQSLVDVVWKKRQLVSRRGKPHHGARRHPARQHVRHRASRQGMSAAASVSLCIRLFRLSLAAFFITSAKEVVLSSPFVSRITQK